MENHLERYEEIKTWKEERMFQYKNDPIFVNDLHDTVMKKVFDVTIHRLGPPPCNFCWFITGSGGRKEQAYFTDQDHGIIFESPDETCKNYFFQLGKQLSNALHFVGYPYCDGNVMSSNPLWCQSISEWKDQLENWLEDASFASIRYVLIFSDARCLKGEKQWIYETKQFLFRKINEQPELFRRFVDNTAYVKKATGPFGQMLVEEKGKRHGMINIKQLAYLPYVNVFRLLSIKEGMMETATIERIRKLKQMSKYRSLLVHAEEDFSTLLQFRLKNSDTFTYEDAHYIHWDRLQEEERKTLKSLIKRGNILHKVVHRKMKRIDLHGS